MKNSWFYRSPCRLRRRELRDRPPGAGAARRSAKSTSASASLFPFALTGDQNRVVAAIGQDLKQDRPMQRLLQADVGAGKTAVAVYALLITIANKHQAALMAPTEVLARQHWRTLEKHISPKAGCAACC